MFLEGEQVFDPGQTVPTGTFDATSVIVKIEIEVDDWMAQTEAYVDVIKVNGQTVWSP